MRILIEHTELQVIAERFRQVADALERGDRSARADAVEGLQVYQKFLVGIHQKREAILAAEVRPAVDSTIRTAFARCAAEHPISDRFTSEAGACLRDPTLSTASAHTLAGLLREEAIRVVEHHRWETETIYQKIRSTLAPEIVARLVAAMRPLEGEASAAHTRLMAWSSHANPASD